MGKQKSHLYLKLVPQEIKHDKSLTYLFFQPGGTTLLAFPCVRLVVYRLPMTAASQAYYRESRVTISFYVWLI